MPVAPVDWRIEFLNVAWRDITSGLFYTRHEGRTRIAATNLETGVGDTVVLVVSGLLSMKYLAGGSESDTIGARLAQPLVAQVSGPDGQPYPGARLTFQSLPASCVSRQTGPYTCYRARLGPAEDTSFVTLADSAGVARAAVLLGLGAGPAVVRLMGQPNYMFEERAFTVLPGAPDNIWAQPADTVMQLGSSFQLRASVVDRGENAVAGAVTYQSLTPVVGATAAGLVTGLDYGRGYVGASATIAGGSVTDSSAITVVPVARIAYRGSLTDLTGNSRKQVYDSGTAILDWSPTRDRILFLGTSRGLSVGDTLGHASVIAADTPGVAEWSRDGAWIYFRADTTIYRVHPDGTGRERVFGARSAFSFSLSPDGGRLVYLGGTGYVPTIRDLGTGNSAVLPNANEYARIVRWSPDGQWIAYVDGSFIVKLIHPDGTAKREFPRNIPASASLSWSSDSRWVLGDARSLYDTITGAAYHLSGPSTYAAWRP
jgi:hypothetical protein